MKTCFKCDIEKEISEFYKHNGMSDGYLNKCKECTKLDTKVNTVDYVKTEKGVITVLYKTQKRNSIIRKHPKQDYTKEEFRIWLYQNNYKELYENWKKHGYRKDLKPSPDRINDHKPYTLDNLTLDTFGSNRIHQVNDIKNGTGTSGRRCKPVIQYKDEIEIARYVSFSQARRIMGYSMERPLKTRKIDRRGYSYKYE